MTRNYGNSNPTEKQLSYAGALARKLGVGTTAIDLLARRNGWSHSKAQAKMSKEELSEAISWALAQ